MNLNDKVAIVTGSSRGIGAATAKELAAAGAKVAVNYVANRDAGEKVLAEIEEAGGRGILVQADVTDEAQVRAMFTRVADELGPVDILVNNAGANFPVVPFTKYSWDAFEAKILGEFKAIFFCCQAVVPGMVERGSGAAAPS
jgi:3-oxoacyl-[acyl-carrier protein] reductase